MLRQFLAVSILLVSFTADANYSRNNTRQANDNRTFELFERLQQMEEQVQSLNGQIEVLQHQVQSMRERQLSQFKDLDARLAKVKADASIAAPAAAAAATAQASIATNNTQVAEQNNNSVREGYSASTTDDSANKQGDKADYRRAFTLIKEKRYPQASTAMRTFLKSYPESAYAANAYYWLGELDLLSGDINAAIQSFDAIVSRFPEHTKMSDALLKLGYIYDDIGQFAKARDYLSRVQKEFPESSAAMLARTRMQQMGRS